MARNHSKLLNEFRNREVNIESNPAVIYVQTVNGCPFTCAMCKNTPTRPKRISEALLKRIHPYFKDLEVLTIHGYGEPLVGDLDSFVKQSVIHDFVLHMNTTGFLLTKQTANLLLKTRLSIRFSIHAGRAETYKRIMGVDLGKVTQNISYLVDASKNSEKKHDFWFSFIVMKENINEIGDFLHLSHDCGIKSVRFMRLDSSRETLRGVKIRGFQFKHYDQYNAKIRAAFLHNMSKYKKLAEELDITIETGSIPLHSIELNNAGELANKVTNKVFGKRFFPVIPSRGGCAAPWIGQMIITQEGNVRLCCASPYSLGNLYNQSLEEIWKSDKMRKIRQSFRKGFYPRVCGYCKGFDLNNYPNNSFVGVNR